MPRTTLDHVVRDEQLGVDTAVLNHSRRFTVEAGTRISVCVLSIHDYKNDYLKTEEEARRRVILAYERRFGPIRWACASMQIVFLTVQVLVELRVEQFK